MNLKKRKLSLGCAATMALLFASGAFAQPANDECASATSVVDGDNAIDNTLATQSVTLPQSCMAYDWANYQYAPASFSGLDVWYTYTAPVTGIRNFEIVNNANSVPSTFLSLYDACNGTLLACDLGGGIGPNGKIYHFPVTSGTTYVIRYAGYQTGQAAATLNISVPKTPVAFDDCELATPVAGEGLVPFSSVGLTNSDVTKWDCGYMRKDGWFAWTPSMTGTAMVSGCGTVNASRLQLSAYTACGTAPLVCNFNIQDPPNAFCTPRLVWPVVAGQTYIVRFGGSRMTEDYSGNLTFEVRPPSTPITIPAGAIAEAEPCSNNPADESNGGCAIPSDAAISMNFCTVYSGTATARRNFPVIGGLNTWLDVDNDVYRFTLDADDTVTITGQSEFMPRMAIRVGCNPPVNLFVSATNNTTPNVASVYSLGEKRVSGVVSPFVVSLVAGTYDIVIAPLGGGVNWNDCGYSNRYWLKVERSTPCAPVNENCCRGTTCNAIAAGSCTGTVAGSASITVASCGSGAGLTTCCYADFNHDGTQSVDDLFLYFNAYFTASPWANYGGDGIETPTIDDLFLYINAYFTGCT